MHADMRTLLNAYLDGELHGTRLRAMETHLATCATCRNELSELHLVSDLLRADPVPEFTPAERFVSQLTLNMPRRLPRVRPAKSGSVAWWLVQAGLLGAWFFVQTVFTLTGVFTAANLTGLLGHAANWLGGGERVSFWFSTAASLFGSHAVATQPALTLLNDVSIIGASVFGGFLLQAVIVILYWAWLFFWWFRHNSRLVKMQNAS